MHLLREILEGIENDTEAVLINLHQSKAYVESIIGFWWLFWRSLDLNRVPQMARHFVPISYGSASSERLVLQSCPLSLLIYVIAFKPLLCGLRNEKAKPVLCRIVLPRCHRMKISTYADDVTVFVSCHFDIITVQKAAKHKKVSRAKINLEKSEGCGCGWKSDASLPDLFG